jgi:hypothetical protein
MSTQSDDTPPEVLAALGRALADDEVRGGLSDDAEGALRRAGVDVDRLPSRVLDVLGSATREELEELGRACATVAAFSDRMDLPTSEFL